VTTIGPTNGCYYQRKIIIYIYWLIKMIYGGSFDYFDSFFLPEKFIRFYLQFSSIWISLMISTDQSGDTIRGSSFVVTDRDASFLRAGFACDFFRSSRVGHRYSILISYFVSYGIQRKGIVYSYMIRILNNRWNINLFSVHLQEGSRAHDSHNATIRDNKIGECVIFRCICWKYLSRWLSRHIVT